MANRKKNQFWKNYKISFETINNQLNFIENYYLETSKLLTTNTESKNNTNKNNYTSTYKNIENANSLLNLMKTDLKSVKITADENLKSKKINTFKNFIIRFFTFGKINKNKNVESEISNFKSNYQKLKDRIKDIDQKLNKERSNFLTKINKKHILLEEQLAEYKAKIIEKENEIQAYQKEIGELQQVNIQYQKIQDQHNDKIVNKFRCFLESVIREKDEEIKILNQKLEETKKDLTDSGNESDSNTSNINFVKKQINAAVSNEKKTPTKNLNIFKYN